MLNLGKRQDPKSKVLISAVSTVEPHPSQLATFFFVKLHYCQSWTRGIVVYKYTKLSSSF